MSSLAGDAPAQGSLKILNLALGQDTGGQQSRMMAVWKKYFPTDRYLSVTQKRTFYPIEVPFDRHRLARQWWPEADVVHLHNDLASVLNRVKQLHPIADSWKSKPRLIHYHGTAFRTRPDYALWSLKRYPSVAVASTLDLVAIAPEQIRWLPAPYDLDVLQSYRSAPTDPDTLHIAHAPTNRAVKGTDILVAAVERLRAEGHRVTLDIIENVSNAECLRRKGKADVFVDQLLLGYGCNAIEAFGMGIPVIAGVDVDRCEQRIRQKIPATTPALMEAVWDGYPFLQATEDTLQSALLQMMNADVRATYARKGMEHFLRFHAAPVVVSSLRTLYQEAISSVGT